MKAEQKLDQLSEGPIEGLEAVRAYGEAWNLAREAIALLRESGWRQWDEIHTCPGPMTQGCRCGLSDFQKRRQWLLDGKPEAAQTKEE